MSNPCAASTLCPNGNCIGCSNGVINCSDPRCYPNCPNCNNSSSNSNGVLITIILILLGILLILAFIIGYDWYSSRQKASEPKHITINKHVHRVNPPSITVSSPPPTVVTMRPLTSIRASTPSTYSKSNSRPIVSLAPPKMDTSNISYDGPNLTMDGIPSSYNMKNDSSNESSFIAPLNSNKNLASKSCKISPIQGLE